MLGSMVALITVMEWLMARSVTLMQCVPLVFVMELANKGKMKGRPAQQNKTKNATIKAVTEALTMVIICVARTQIIVIHGTLDAQRDITIVQNTETSWAKLTH
jgi:hypothetical protein